MKKDQPKKKVPTHYIDSSISEEEFEVGDEESSSEEEIDLDDESSDSDWEVSLLLFLFIWNN